MGEYGGVVRHSTSAGGGGAAGSFDPIANVTDLVSDIVGRIAALPPEILLVLVAGMIIGGLLVFRRV